MVSVYTIKGRTNNFYIIYRRIKCGQNHFTYVSAFFLDVWFFLLLTVTWTLRLLFRHSFIEILLSGESREQNSCPAKTCINKKFRTQRHFCKCVLRIFVSVRVFVFFLLFFSLFLFVLFYLFIFLYFFFFGGGSFVIFFTVQSVMYVKTR